MEWVLPVKVAVQDVAQETAQDKGAPVVLAVEDVVVVDAEWVATVDTHQISIILGWKIKSNPCKLPCKASQNDWML
jgi:hypothetical protein